MYIHVFVCIGQWLCEVERFDPVTNQWSLIEPMNHSRTGVAVTALKGLCVWYNPLSNGHFGTPFIDQSFSRLSANRLVYFKTSSKMPFLKGLL